MSEATGVSTLQLDLDQFSGPFDLLLTLVLREELDLLDFELADLVLAYLEHLEQRGELDLETATEFIVLVAALLELKSRLMLAPDEEELLELEPEQAADELLARMLAAQRFRGAATYLRELLAGEEGVRFRAVPPPPQLRHSVRVGADGSQDPALLGAALGRLLLAPPPLEVRHIRAPRVSLEARLRILRSLLARGPFAFEEAVRGADRMTVAVTLVALLELYRRGEADWRQSASFGEITVVAAHRGERGAAAG